MDTTNWPTLDAEVGAAAFVEMACNFPVWIKRRVDQLTFSTSTTLDRTVRLDVDLGGVPSLAVGSNGGLVLPVHEVERSGAHTLISVRGASGELLPRTTRQEERQLLAVGLSWLIGANEPASWRSAAVVSLRRALDTAPGEHLYIPEDLAAATPLLRRFHRSFLVTVVLDDPRPRRLVLDIQLEEQAPARRRLWRLAAASPVPFELAADSAGDCESYHLVLTVPPDVGISDAAVTATKHSASDGSLMNCRETERYVSRAHLQLNVGVPCNADFTARLYPLPNNLVRLAPWSAGFSAFVLLGGALWCTFIEGTHGFRNLDASAGTAIILLVPALAGTVLVAPNEHTLRSRLVFPERVALVLASVAVYFAAFTVAMKWSGGAVVAAWWALFAFVLGVTSVLARRYLTCARLLRARLRTSVSPTE